MSSRAIRSMAVGVAAGMVGLIGVAAAAEPIELFEDPEPTENGGASGPGAETGPPSGESPVVETLSSGEVEGATPGRTRRVVELPFERRGSVLVVPARVEGHPVMFVYDTGAAYTTLTPRFARRAGVSPPEDAPSKTMQTPGGTTRMRLGIVDGLTLDGHRQTGVTFALCSRCSFDLEIDGRPVVGLLGLNLLRRFRNEIDESEGRVRLVPDGSTDERRADIRPWLRVDIETRILDTAGERTVRILARVQNRAPRAVRELELALECSSSDGPVASMTGSPLSLPASSTRTTVLEAPRREGCGAWRRVVRSASW